MSQPTHTLGIVLAVGAADRFLKQIPHVPMITAAVLSILSAYQRPDNGRFKGVEFAGLPLGKVLSAAVDGLTAYLAFKIGKHIGHHKGFEHILRHKLALGGFLATTLFRVWNRTGDDDSGFESD